MLEQVFKSSRSVARCRSNVLGKHLDDFTGFLLGRGHSLTSIRNYMHSVEHFGGWLSRRSRKCVVDESQVDFFLQKHLPVCKCLPPTPRHLNNARAALKQFFTMLRDQGHLPQPVREDRTPIDRTISAFHDHLERVCGLGAVTCFYRARYVRHGDAPIQLAAGTLFLRRPLARAGRRVPGAQRLGHLPAGEQDGFTG